MSSIHFDQNGAVGSALVLGARVHLSFDGSTTTYAWSFTAQPSTSTETMHDDTTDAPFFEPDTYGEWDIQLVDDLSNVFTLALTCNQPISIDIVQAVNEEFGRAYFMPDVFGIPGRKFALYGQNTSTPGLGGQAEVASGVSASGTYGVVLSERVLGNAWLTYQIAQFYAFQGIASSMVLVGGSTSQFTFDGSNCTIVTVQSNDQLYFDADRGFIRDSGVSNTLMSWDTDKVGFHGATPVVRATRPGQLTDNTGGAVDGTLVDVTTVAIADPAKVNANFADCADRINKIEAALSAIGILTA